MKNVIKNLNMCRLLSIILINISSIIAILKIVVVVGPVILQLIIIALNYFITGYVVIGEVHFMSGIENVKENEFAGHILKSEGDIRDEVNNNEYGEDASDESTENSSTAGSPPSLINSIPRDNSFNLHNPDERIQAETLAQDIYEQLKDSSSLPIEDRGEVLTKGVVFMGDSQAMLDNYHEDNDNPEVISNIEELDVFIDLRESVHREILRLEPEVNSYEDELEGLQEEDDGFTNNSNDSSDSDS